jgi:hypothetical protein
MFRFMIPLSVAMAVSGMAAQACTSENYKAKGLSQDWPAKDRAAWYELSQGSRLIPMAWYEVLLLSGEYTKFSDRENQERYASQFCADSDLPIGLVVDVAEGRDPALGLTCSACHTGVLHVGTREYVVEGGSSDLDLQTYMADMFLALADAYSDASVSDAGVTSGALWQSFTQGVLEDGHSAEENLALETEVRDWLQRRYQIQESIEAGGKWGHGRTDAVGPVPAKL